MENIVEQQVNSQINPDYQLLRLQNCRIEDIITAQLTQEQKDQIIGINLRNVDLQEQQLLDFALQFQNLEILLADIQISDDALTKFALELNNFICYNEITMDESITLEHLLQEDKYHMLTVPYEFKQENEQQNIQDETQQESIQQQKTQYQDITDYNDSQEQEYAWLHVTKQINQKYLFNHLPQTIEYVKLDNYLITQSEINENTSVQYLDILNINIESQTDNVQHFITKFKGLKFLIAKQLLLSNKFIEELQNNNIKIYINQNEQEGLQHKLEQLYQSYEDYSKVIDKNLITYDEVVEISQENDIKKLENKLYNIIITEECTNDLIILQNLQDIKISIIKIKCKQNSFNYDDLKLFCQLHTELRQIECNLQLNNEQVKQLKQFNIIRYNNKVIGKLYFGTYQNQQDLQQKLMNTMTKSEQEVAKLQQLDNETEDKQQQKEDNNQKEQDENQNLVISSLQDNQDSNKSDIDNIINDLENQSTMLQQNQTADKIEKTLYTNNILETSQQFDFAQPQKLQYYTEEQLQNETNSIIQQFNQNINNLLGQDQRESIPNIETLIKRNIEKVKKQQVYCQDMIHKCETSIFYQSQAISTDVKEQPLAQALRKVNEHHQKFIDSMNDYKQDLETLNDNIYSIAKTDLLDIEKQIIVAFDTINDISEYGMNASTINDDIRSCYMKSASQLKQIQQNIYLQQYNRQAKKYINDIYFTKRINPDDFVQSMNNKEEVYINEFSKNQVIQMFINAVSAFQKLQQQNTAAQVNFYHYFNNTFFATKFGQHFADIRREKYYHALELYWDESNIIRCISNTLKYNTFSFFNLSYVNLQTVVYQLLLATIMEFNQNMIEEEIFKLVDQMKINGIPKEYANNVIETLKQVLDETQQQELQLVVIQTKKIDWIELVAVAMLIKGEKEQVWKDQE